MILSGLDVLQTFAFPPPSAILFMCFAWFVWKKSTEEITWYVAIKRKTKIIHLILSEEQTPQEVSVLPVLPQQNPWFVTDLLKLASADLNFRDVSGLLLHSCQPLTLYYRSQQVHLKAVALRLPLQPDFQGRGSEGIEEIKKIQKTREGARQKANNSVQVCAQERGERQEQGSRRRKVQQPRKGSSRQNKPGRGTAACGWQALGCA